jgi:hypothetical protein
MRFQVDGGRRFQLEIAPVLGLVLLQGRLEHRLEDLVDFLWLEVVEVPLDLPPDRRVVTTDCRSTCMLFLWRVLAPPWPSSDPSPKRSLTNADTVSAEITRKLASDITLQASW